MDELLATVVWFLLDILLAKTGAVAVRMFTLGRWQAEVTRTRTYDVNAAAGALSYRHHGTRIVTYNGSVLTGALVWFLAAVGLWQLFAS